MDISVVIPLFNEEESLPELTEWIHKVMQKHKFSYEIIMIDDGSVDKSWHVVNLLSDKSKNVRGIRFRRNYGKSAAIFSGFDIAEGDVVITMDADLQDSPDEIPALYDMITGEGYDLVSGWKKKRFDPISKTLPSKLFNWTARKFTGIKLHDFNCGLKAYRKAVVKSIEVYGEMHRYIPVLAKSAGFCSIGEKVVSHQARKYGKTKFGLERFINGILDLVSITFISKFSKRPMHLFGLFGVLMFLFGVVSSIWLLWSKIYALTNHLPVRDIVDHPLFYIGLTTIIMGVQLFLAGFVAELISRNSPDRNKYQISEKIGIERE